MGIARKTILSVGALAVAGTMASAFVQTDVEAAAEEYRVEAIHVENFIGTIRVEVGGSNSVRLDMTGPAAKLAKLEAEKSGDVLVIEGEDEKRGWNKRGGVFRKGFDEDDYPVLTIRAPKGTKLTAEEVAGAIKVGDLGGALVLEDVSLEGSIGDVESAKIGISGRGDLELGDVEKALTLAIAGSGEIEAGDVGGRAKISIAGSGDIEIGAVGAGLNVGIHGGGDAEVESVSGPLSVAINGSGDVTVKGGTADPFSVAINGSGDMTFGGTAKDPKIAVNGSGNVRLGAYEGSMKSTGNGTILVRPLL